MMVGVQLSHEPSGIVIPQATTGCCPDFERNDSAATATQS
jgi:hypothetical protein